MITKLIDWSGHPTKGKPEKMLWRYGIYAGLDVGRFVHPSHLAVIASVEQENEYLNEPIPWKERHYVQIASVWLDDVPYSEQIREIQSVLSCGAKFVRLLYDDTRGELVALREQGLLPTGWRGVVLTAENKREMAQRLLLALEQDRLKLLPDERQKRSLLQVNNLLKAEEVGSEHGEAFTSLMLALEATRVRPQVESFYIRGLYG